MKKWTAVLLVLALSFALAAPGFAASLGAPIEISLVSAIDTIETKHIQELEVEAKNTAKGEKDFLLVLALADSRGELLSYVLSEEHLDGGDVVRLKQYAKMAEQAYEVQIFAWDNELRKNLISNTVRVPIASGYIEKDIAELPALRVTVPQWTAYTMPQTVDAVMNTGETEAVEVRWNGTVDTTKTGVQTITGTVVGYRNQTVTLTVTVVAADQIIEIAPLSVTVDQGQKFTLPVTAAAKMKSGMTEYVLVEWQGQADTSQAGTYHYTGKTKGFAGEIQLTLTVNAANEEAVYDFKNEDIRAAAAGALGLPAGEDITKKQLRTITTLDLSYLSDSNLEDLRQFTALEKLDLTISGVEELEPIADLAMLRELNLYGNENLRNIAPLYRLNLAKLWLGGTAVTDFSATAPYYASLVEKDFTLDLLKADGEGNIEKELTLGQTYPMPICIQAADGSFPLVQWDQAEIFAQDEGKVTVTGALLESGGEVALHCEIVDVPDYPIEWKDAAIEQGVRKAIDKQTGTIYYSEVKNLKELDCFGLGVKSLEDLKHMRNLTYLGVAANYLDDSQWQYITHLTKMEYLDLGINQFTYVPAGAFKNMSSLIEICLDENNITTIEPGAFMGQENLTSLLMEDNYNLRNIEEVKNLTHLKDLLISRTGVVDLSPIAGLRELETFWAKNCMISDISALADKPDMVHVDISVSLDRNGNVQGRVTDISALEDSRNLDWVAFSGNRITDISCLEGMQKLRHLDLQYNQIDDISALHNCIGLERLYLANNQITDVSPLANVAGITSIYLQNNLVQDVTPLAGLKNLKNLYLAGNQVTDYTSLKEIYNNLVGKDFYL